MIVSLERVSKVYAAGVAAVRDVSLSIEDGELIGVLGPSGSGKSTLLHLVGALDRPSSGTVRIGGRDVASLSDRAASALRADLIGFVFQRFHLLPGRSALRNVAEGLLYSGLPRLVRLDRAREALERVGLAGRADHRPHELSGGECQRVAIARAVAGRPALLLADEPTGNLDSVASAVILDLLREVNRSGTTVVVITHDGQIAEAMPRCVRLRDGRVDEAVTR